MKKFLVFFVGAVCLLSFAGCMTVSLTAEGIDKPAAMTSNINKKFTIVKSFDRDEKGYFTIFNLVTISDQKINEVIKNELIAAQGDAVINIRI